MTQDTRRDRRVKIVSLNVRYKSATVDEFIENHALDVSRGGIYVKTSNPFPPGTLLKFEIRLVSDQAVITGVGRVVWKRDGGQGSGERPAGMGVKFIKIDEPSRALVDKLINTRADAGQSFESEPQSPLGAPRKPVQTPTGVHAATRVGSASSPPMRKATIVGLGSPTTTPSSSPSSPAEAARRSVPPRASSPPLRPDPGANMFPNRRNFTSSIPQHPEQTVMKQAAELLEEALREAGGSMGDMGTIPVFGSGGTAAGSNASAALLPAGPASAPGEPNSSPPPSSHSGARPLEDPSRTHAMVTTTSPAPDHDQPLQSGATLILREPLPNVRLDIGTRRSPSRPPSSPSRPPAAPRGDRDIALPRDSGVTKWLWLVALAVGAVAGLVFRDRLFGGSEASNSAPPAASPAASAETPVAVPGAPSAAPSGDLAAPTASAAATTTTLEAGGPQAPAAGTAETQPSPPPSVATPVPRPPEAPRPPPRYIPPPAAPVATRPPSVSIDASSSANVTMSRTAAPPPSAATSTSPAATSSANGATLPPVVPSSRISDDNPYND
jgi:uncharacterized protein (TIGR02266 family)